MRAVIDTSYLIEFFSMPFNDLFRWIMNADLITTTLLSYELHNVLLKALKIDCRDLDKFHRILKNLKLEYADIRGNEGDIYKLSTTHNLSFYDASYLWLAVREKLPIATYDKQILQAADLIEIKTIAAETA